MTKSNADKYSHVERVAMREMIREMNVIPPDSNNEVADNWLMRHGYLHHAGYKPPENRVDQLARHIGYRRKRRAKKTTTKQPHK